MCYFFKKIKNLLQFTFEKKITCCAKKREKNNLLRGKIPAPLLWISLSDSDQTIWLIHYFGEISDLSYQNANINLGQLGLSAKLPL